MKTKEKIVETLENKRINLVWDLIGKTVKEIYNGEMKIPEETKEEYFSCEETIEDKNHRYLIIEHYNLDSGFYCEYQEDGCSVSKMYEDYFDDSDGDCQETILLVDMKEMKCYLLDKEVKYNKEEVKI